MLERIEFGKVDSEKLNLCSCLNYSIRELLAEMCGKYGNCILDEKEGLGMLRNSS